MLPFKSCEHCSLGERARCIWEGVWDQEVCGGGSRLCGAVYRVSDQSLMCIGVKTHQNSFFNIPYRNGHFLHYMAHACVSFLTLDF